MPTTEVTGAQPTCLACSGPIQSQGTLPLSLVLGLYRELFGLRWSEQELREFAFADQECFSCPACSLRQFPKATPGPAGFYRRLAQTLPWYYPEQRWETGPVLDWVKPTHEVVEIGCGSGRFIKHAAARGRKVTGFELSEEAIERGRKDGLSILHASAAKDYSGNFDGLLLLQVLEHVPDPRSFVQEHLHLVKKGGYVMVSVPLLDSWCGYVPDPLAYPPHHVTSWTERSLRALGERLGLQTICVRAQPVTLRKMRGQMRKMQGLSRRALPVYFAAPRPSWPEETILRKLHSSFYPHAAAELLGRQRWAWRFHTGLAVYRVAEA